MSKQARSRKISTLGSQVASVISVSLVLYILGALMSLGIGTSGIRSSILSDVSVIVKMDITATDDDCEQLSDLLVGSSFAQTTEYLSADAVLEQEMEQNADILELLGENPFSSEFIVKLVPEYANPDSIRNIIQLIEERASGIEEVISPIDVVATVDKAVKNLTWLLTVIAILLLAISVVLIYNTVSIAVYGRRFVIRTMQLVGATGSFIRTPFVKAGILSGLVSGIISSALLMLSLYYIKTTQRQLFLDLSWQELTLIIIILLLIGMIICAISAYLATTRYLSASYDDLYS